jgi:TatD DNase family protein
VVAVGEFGLDYDRLQFCEAAVQRQWFEAQLDLSDATRLPLFLHCRNSGTDFADILRKNRHKYHAGGVVHSFDGTLDELKMHLDNGFYIGINGCSLKTAENLVALSHIPLDRLLLEVHVA